MWKTIQHYSNALLLRSRLMREVKKAKENGFQIPISMGDILKKPQIYQAYIWLWRFFKTEDKFTLIDIGGNTGYWSEDFRKFFPGTKVFAFEPVKEAFGKYSERYQGNNDVKVYNTALSFEEGQEEINVAAGFGLTSFLEYGAAQKDLNKHFERKEKVKIDTLDHYQNKILTPENRSRKIIVKIDVQGFELNVLKGAVEILNNVDALIIECSFVNEFTGQNPTFPHLTKILVEYDLYPVSFGVYDIKKSAYGWERDVLFVKREKLDHVWGY